MLGRVTTFGKLHKHGVVLERIADADHEQTNMEHTHQW